MDESTNFDKIAEMLNIEIETIENSLDANYIGDDTFVPLRKISKEEQETKNNLLKIKGILITDTNVRIYPYKETTSALTGYVQGRRRKSRLRICI